VGEWLVEVLIGLSVALPGAVLAMVAESIPPNALVGFRVSYAMTSRRVWIHVNRTAGIALAVIGASAVPVGLIAGVIAEAVFLSLGVTASVIALVEYSRRLAELESLRTPPPEGPVVEVRRRAATSAAMGAAATLAVSTLAAAAPRLAGVGPAYLVTASSLAALAVYLCYLASMRPESFQRPWLEPSEAELVAVLVGWGLALVSAGINLAPLNGGPGEASLPLVLAGLSATLAAASISTAAWLRGRSELRHGSA